MLLYKKKDKAMDISETYINIKGQGHSLNLVQGHSDSTFSNFFSWETVRLIEVKFHVAPKWDGGTKIYSNGPGHMTKMAAMPIYGKKHEKFFFSGTKRLMSLRVCMQHWVLKCYQVYSKMTLGWHWPILLQGQIRSLMLLHRKKITQWILQKLL